MKTKFKSQKLDWCKEELKILVLKLHKGNYHQTADVVYGHVAHTGVETDLDENLKKEPTLEEFIKTK